MLPAPSGPYRVGTALRSFTDLSRREIASSDSTDLRTLYTQIWYPTQGSGSPAPYLGDTANRSGFSELEGTTWLHRFMRIRTNAIANAPLATGQDRYPVVLFAAGFGLSKNYNTQLLEGLASYGYIVVGVDLPYVNPLVTDTGEALHSTDSYWDGFPMTKGTDDYEAGKARIAMKDDYFAADYLFLHEQLHQLNESELFHRAMDLKRVAVLGHSAGASPAFALMKRAESPFNAFVVYDVNLHANYASREIVYPKRLLTSAPIYLFAFEYAMMPPDDFVRSLAAELTITRFVGAHHGSLTDIDFIRASAEGDTSASTAARRHISRIIAYTVDFLAVNNR